STHRLGTRLDLKLQGWRKTGMWLPFQKLESEEGIICRPPHEEGPPSHQGILQEVKDLSMAWTDRLCCRYSLRRSPPQGLPLAGCSAAPRVATETDAVVLQGTL